MTISITGAPQPAYGFTVTALNSEASPNAGSATYVIEMADGTTSSSGSITAPAFAGQVVGTPPIASSESVIDLLTGVGAHVTFRSYEDYNLTNNFVTATGVGNAIPEVLLGAGFTTYKNLISTNCTGQQAKPPTGPKHCGWRAFIKNTLPNSIFLNVQVPVGSSSSANGNIDGFTFGGGYRIQKFLEIMAGFSLAQYNEPSPGFRNAAIAVIKANAALPSNQQVPLYLQYSTTAIQNKVPGSLDGFPIFQQELSGAPGGQIYQGSPLTNHYRGGLFVGLAFPLSLNKLFGLPSN